MTGAAPVRGDVNFCGFQKRLAAKVSELLPAGVNPAPGLSLEASK